MILIHLPLNSLVLVIAPVSFFVQYSMLLSVCYSHTAHPPTLRYSLHHRTLHTDTQQHMNGYKPLMMSWPLYHKANSSNSPPLQLAILKYILPTPAKHDNQVLYGQDFSNDGTDLPWMAQEGQTQLRRGDVVAVFSDGIGDNLRLHNLVAAVNVMYEHILHAYTKPYTIPFLLHGAVEEHARRGNPAPSAITDITEDQENILAGNASALLASTIVRYCQRSWKVDDMSVVVGIVV
uniref:Uncharacterized protein n=1 Tax=Lygus hesperus TaxID=30085 RepID=A0A146KWS9_LYGHE